MGTWEHGGMVRNKRLRGQGEDADREADRVVVFLLDLGKFNLKFTVHRAEPCFFHL